MWKRGTPLAAARTVKEIDGKLVGLNVVVGVDGNTRWPMLSVSKGYWDSDLFLGLPNGKFVPVPLPEILQLPVVVHTYLAEIGVTAATRVKLNPDGSITEVLSKKGVRPRVCGNIICQASPVAA